MSSTRSFIPLALIVMLLAACGTAGSATPTAQPSEVADPSTEPSTPAEPSTAPSEEPSVEPIGNGTLTMVDGQSVGGPGVSVGEAIESGITEPVLVRGILLMDPQGKIWICDGFAGGGVPTCGEPMLEVVGYPETTGDWDPANAPDTGLQEADGVLWFDEAFIYGVVEAS